MSDVYPDDAPKGFIAKENERGCTGCSFISGEKCVRPVGDVGCTPGTRDDHKSVIFIPRPKPTPMPNPSTATESDPVNHPAHYTSSPAKCVCGAKIEWIQITEHMGFNPGNAVKYIWRADLKNDAIEDLRKASWYINREIEKRMKEAKK